MIDFSVIISVVKRGKASRVLRTLKRHGATGGTIVLAEGTADNEILEFIDYHHVRKEVIYSVISNDREEEVFDALNDRYHFDKPNHGIAFTVPLNEVITTKDSRFRDHRLETSNMEYEVVFVVVENHRGEDVVSIAAKYGAKGGTIIHGRGSGLHEKGSIFNITIEPEKEIVMLLVKDEMHRDIVEGLRKELDIDEPGNGIIFSAGVNNAIGLVE